MKNCLLVLVAGVMLSVPLGCDRQVDEDPVSYDREVDGPPVAIRTPMPDYEIIGEPADVRRRREALREAGEEAASGAGAKTGGGGNLSGPSVAATADEIAEVKAVIERVLATKDSGDDAAAMAFFDDEAATVIQKITQGTKDIQAKSLALHSLMETKFGAQYPDGIKESNQQRQTEPMGPGSPAEMMGNVSIDQLLFAKIGEKVVATGPKNDKLIFTKTADGWKIGFDQNAREMTGALGELLDGAKKMIDAVIAGVQDDSITPANVEAKVAELTAQFVDPPQKKLEALMLKGAGGGAKPPVGGGGAATRPAAGGGGGVPPAGGAATQPAGGGL